MRVILAMALLVGCNGDKGDDTGGDGGDGGGDGGSEDRFADYVNVTTTPTGNVECFNYPDWLTQELDEAKAGHMVAMTGEVVDFETGDPVPDATVEIWYSNSPTGTPDVNETTEADGTFGAPYPTCQPTAYKVSTDPELEETKDTFEVNQVEAYSESEREVEFNSVSSTTYAIIPSLLGVSPDADKGIAAGQIYDCNEDNVEGAQVVVVDEAGNIPEELVVKYFVDEFPNRNQEYTSPDGLWVAINIPTGDWTVQAWVSDGAGGHKLIGQSKLPIQADSINIASIYTGYEDGVMYPDNCTAGFE